MTSTIKTIYSLLGVNTKFNDRLLRVTYLREVWGLPQSLIAECEGVGQSVISRDLKDAKRKYGYTPSIEFETNEIKYLQQVPRDILGDVHLISFVQNILGLNPIHPFYDSTFTNDSVRIAALSALGIQQGHLMKIFDKSQPAISMCKKRVEPERLAIENRFRYELEGQFKLIPRKFKTPFTLAGGHY